MIGTYLSINIVKMEQVTYIICIIGTLFYNVLPYRTNNKTNKQKQLRKNKWLYSIIL